MFLCVCASGVACAFLGSGLSSWFVCVLVFVCGVFGIGGLFVFMAV